MFALGLPPLTCRPGGNPDIEETDERGDEAVDLGPPCETR